jgi:hypothetical protein
MQQMTRRGLLAGAVAIPAATFAIGRNKGARAAPPAQELAEPTSLIIRRGREFAANSYVHSSLPDDAPLDPNSRRWVAEFNRQWRAYYNSVSVNIDEYTPPVYVVGPDLPTVQIKPDRPEDPTFPVWGAPLKDQLAAVPLPVDFKPSPGEDKEAIIYQPSMGKYWELMLAARTGAKIINSAGETVDEWSAGWGGYIANLAINPGYFEPDAGTGYKFGASATGIPYLAGLITIEEQRQGVIDHPLHFCLVEASRDYFAFPAQRLDGAAPGAHAIPEGVRFRFPTSLDLDSLGLDPYGLMIAKAIQKYGMICRDTGGAVVLYAENPAGRYRIDPYRGKGGILRCDTDTDPTCWAATKGRLGGIPWDKLQALKTSLTRLPT